MSWKPMSKPKHQKRDNVSTLPRCISQNPMSWKPMSKPTSKTKRRISPTLVAKLHQHKKRGNDSSLSYLEWQDAAQQKQKQKKLFKKFDYTGSVYDIHTKVWEALSRTCRGDCQSDGTSWYRNLCKAPFKNKESYKEWCKRMSNMSATKRQIVSHEWCSTVFMEQLRCILDPKSSQERVAHIRARKKIKNEIRELKKELAVKEKELVLLLRLDDNQDGDQDGDQGGDQGIDKKDKDDINEGENDDRRVWVPEFQKAMTIVPRSFWDTDFDVMDDNTAPTSIQFELPAVNCLPLQWLQRASDHYGINDLRLDYRISYSRIRGGFVTGTICNVRNTLVDDDQKWRTVVKDVIRSVLFSNRGFCLLHTYDVQKSLSENLQIYIQELSEQVNTSLINCWSFQAENYVCKHVLEEEIARVIAAARIYRGFKRQFQKEWISE